MINLAQIPDEAVEAGAIAAMKDNGCGLTVDGKHVLCCDDSVKGLIGAYGEPLWCAPDDCSCRTMARAAIAAALNAWETPRHRAVIGVCFDEVNNDYRALILPLPEGDA